MNELNRYYHLSRNGAIEKLIPRVPAKLWNDHEDNYVERICFSNTINGCLRALFASEGDIFHIYTPLGKPKLYYPTELEVIDQDITGEVWVVDETAIIKIAKIKILRCECVDMAVKQEINLPISNYVWGYMEAAL